MLTVRRANERGTTRIGWLDSRHSFSFGDYYDPRNMGFGALRVINDDRVAANQGFGPHPHRDMEIITYMLTGAIAHGDSMGNHPEIRPGDVQRMTAGTGVVHSEVNPTGEEAHFLQIWLLPNRGGLKPGYEQKRFSDDDKRNTLRLIASPEGQDGSLSIHQDAKLYATVLDGGTVRLPLAKGRRAWVQVALGAATLNGTPLEQGDGVAVEAEDALELSGERAEVLIFDLA
jgi:redox-sensitive bicupin YhaK (pirin superfamily)